jgi:hypothetical protein
LKVLEAEGYRSAIRLRADELTGDVGAPGRASGLPAAPNWSFFL